MNGLVHTLMNTVVITVVNTLVLATITSLTLCAQNTATIEGRVTNSVTGEAVGGVKVRFLDRHSYVYSTTTDSTGSYRLTGLNDGDYRGEFRKDGFSENTGNSSSGIRSLTSRALCRFEWTRS